MANAWLLANSTREWTAVTSNDGAFVLSFDHCFGTQIVNEIGCELETLVKTLPLVRLKPGCHLLPDLVHQSLHLAA